MDFKEPNPAYKGNRTALMTKVVGDDYYDLKLPTEGLMELEERTGRGPYYVLRKLSEMDARGVFVGDFPVTWIIDVIRIALVGGESMTPREAVKFTDTHLRERFVMDYHDLAIDVLSAGLFGGVVEPVVVEEADQSGEPTPKETNPQTPSASCDGENSTSSAEPPA